MVNDSGEFFSLLLLLYCLLMLSIGEMKLHILGLPEAF